MNANHRRPAGGRKERHRSPPASEWIGALLIIIFPIMGNFFAPETYFGPQDFSIEAMEQAELGFPYGRLGYLLVAIWLAFLFLRMPRLFITGIRHAALPLAFMGWALATALWSPDPAASANRSLRILLLGFFLAYLVERFRPAQIVSLMVISGAASIVASLVAVLVIPEYALSSISGYEGAWRGSTPHKNMLGFLMVILFAFACFAMRMRQGRPLTAAVLLGSCALLWLSQSATSLLGLPFALALMALLEILARFPTRPEKLVIAVASLFCLATIGAIVLGEASLLPALGRDTTLTGRTEIWSAVYAMAAENPFWGYSSGFWSIPSPDRDQLWHQLGWAPPHAHNNALDVWFQLGLPGITLLGAIVLSILVRGTRLILGEAPSIARLWLVLIAIVLFSGMSETNMVAASSGGLVWFTLGYLSLGKALRSITRLPTVRLNLATATARPRQPGFLVSE